MHGGDIDPILSCNGECIKPLRLMMCFGICPLYGIERPWWQIAKNISFPFLCPKISVLFYTSLFDSFITFANIVET